MMPVSTSPMVSKIVATGRLMNIPGKFMVFSCGFFVPGLCAPAGQRAYQIQGTHNGKRIYDTLGMISIKDMRS